MGPLPPYAGVSRIRFSGSGALAPLSSAGQRSPGDGPCISGFTAEGKARTPERRDPPIKKAPTGQGTSDRSRPRDPWEGEDYPLAALVRTVPFRPLGKKPPPFTAALLR